MCRVWMYLDIAISTTRQSERSAKTEDENSTIRSKEQGSSGWNIFTANNVCAVIAKQQSLIQRYTKSEIEGLRLICCDFNRAYIERPLAQRFTNKMLRSMAIRIARWPLVMSSLPVVNAVVHGAFVVSFPMLVWFPMTSLVSGSLIRNTCFSVLCCGWQLCRWTRSKINYRLQLFFPKIIVFTTQ